MYYHLQTRGGTIACPPLICIPDKGIQIFISTRIEKPSDLHRSSKHTSGSINTTSDAYIEVFNNACDPAYKQETRIPKRD